MILFPHSRPLICVVYLLAASSAAQSVLPALSFGHTTPISSNGQIPGFHIGFEGPTPSILSDRIILTPPSPGHIRTGLWSDNQLSADTFQLDVEFRASGPERGSGNMQIWFTKDTIPASSLRSVYTVERFEGMALVLDQYGGSAGAVRGFLNDGTVDYKGHHNIDSLAFGHCDYAFRNLGRMSRLQMRADAQGLEVLVDDRSCFKSPMIKFPANYYFGMSAASAETPDSFELSKFAVSAVAGGLPPFPDHHHQQSVSGGALPPPNANYAPPTATEYSAQHHELLNRLHSLSQAVQNLNRELGALSNLQLERHNEMKSSIGNIPAAPNQVMDSMSRRLDTLSADVGHIKKEIGMAGFGTGEYRDSISRLQTALREGQTELMGSLPRNLGEIVSTQAPKMWTFLFCLCAFQLILAGGYVAYKRRWKNSPKKLL